MTRNGAVVVGRPPRGFCPICLFVGEGPVCVRGHDMISMADETFPAAARAAWADFGDSGDVMPREPGALQPDFRYDRPDSLRSALAVVAFIASVVAFIGVSVFATGEAASIAAVAGFWLAALWLAFEAIWYQITTASAGLPRLRERDSSKRTRTKGTVATLESMTNPVDGKRCAGYLAFVMSDGELRWIESNTVGFHVWSGAVSVEVDPGPLLVRGRLPLLRKADEIESDAFLRARPGLATAARGQELTILHCAWNRGDAVVVDTDVTGKDSDATPYRRSRYSLPVRRTEMLVAERAKQHP